MNSGKVIRDKMWENPELGKVGLGTAQDMTTRFKERRKERDVCMEEDLKVG